MERFVWVWGLVLSCGLVPILGRGDRAPIHRPHPSEIPFFNISSDLSEKEGLDELLNSSRYDKRSIPPSHEPLRVSVSVLLLTLASPDESSLKYEVEFLLNLAWSDPRLRYIIINETGALPTIGPDVPYNYDAMPMRLNERKRPFLDALHHTTQVWIPDVYYVKHGDFRHNLDPVHLALRIFPNGTINFTTRRHLILACKGNLPFFPFDDPECAFCIESVSYEKDRLQFFWQGTKGVLRKSTGLSELNAYLERNTTSDYSCLKVELVFNRDRAFYFTTVFIPDIILVTSSFITFWLEWNAVPARIMLGVTTMLNFFTTSNSFRATLPVVSDLTAMNIWDGFSMFFIYASLLEFVFVNYIGRKRPRRHFEAHEMTNMSTERNKTEGNAVEASPLCPPSSSLNHPTEIVACTTCTASPSSHPANNSCPANSQHPLRRRFVENPIGVAKTIDVVSRVVFPCAYTIFVLFFFVKHGALQHYTL